MRTTKDPLRVAWEVEGLSLDDRVRVAEPQGRDEVGAIPGYPQGMVPLEGLGLGSAHTLEEAGRKLGPDHTLEGLLAARTLGELLVARMPAELLVLLVARTLGEHLGLAARMLVGLLALLADHMPGELLVLLPVHTLAEQGLPVHMLEE